MSRLVEYGILLSYLYSGILCSDANYRENRRLSVFDSPHFLATAFTKELLIHQNLEIYRNYINSLLQQIKAGIAKVQILGNGHRHHPDQIIPLHFRDILESVDYKWLRMENIIGSWINNTSFNTVRKVTGTITFYELDSPESAIRGCLLGLLMIEDTYDVNTEHFAKGFVPLHGIANRDDDFPVDAVCKLNAADLLALASHALKINWYESAVRFANYSEHIYQTALQQNIRQYPLDIQQLISNVKVKSNLKLSHLGTSKLSTKDMKFLPFSSKHVFYRNVR